jgi:hypothetical protein
MINGKSKADPTTHPSTEFALRIDRVSPMTAKTESIAPPKTTNTSVRRIACVTGDGNAVQSSRTESTATIKHAELATPRPAQIAKSM